MITKLHLENFRAFQSFTLENLNHITLIGGRNNSGKSAYWKAFFTLWHPKSADLLYFSCTSQ